jgi:pimeloyl-ACP methyl ester carboxylesterase
VIPPQTADLMHKNIVGSELEILKKANHIVVLNEPLELFRTIDGFVRGLLKI